MPKDKIQDNKRIAKNTLLLYVRMLLMMAISLYTSRIVLAALGVSDFGIYNVVGGFVALFTMVSGTMATATQRFLSYEIGRGTQENIIRLFSTSVMIHIMLGVLILLLAETLGLWYVNNKMVFPPERLSAVNWVFQFSVLTLIINVLSVPYNASIIAYEKMAAFAYIGIVDAVLKLSVAYLVVVSTSDKLILYAFLLMLIAIGNRLFYTIYVRRTFIFCRCNWRIDGEYRKSLLSFIGYNFIGSIANIGKTQGINVLLNLFFGTAVNAARGISVQILHAVTGFVHNFQLAMNPQIIKLYAAGEKEEMFKLIFRGSKYSYLLVLILSLPIIIETPYILNLWLVEVPDHTVIFVRLTLAITLVDSLAPALLAGIHASGKVKNYQLTNGTMLMMTLPLVYLVLWLGCEPYMAFVASLGISIICYFIRIVMLHFITGFPMLAYLRQVTFRILLVTILSLMIPMTVSFYKDSGFMWFVISIVVTVLSTVIFVFFIGLTQVERKSVIIRIKSKCIRNNI